MRYPTQTNSSVLFFSLDSRSGGFFIESDQLPVWIAWFRYVSFINYGFNAMGNLEFPKNSGDRIIEEVRKSAGFNDLTYWENVGAILGLIVVMKLMGFLFLKYLRGPKFLRF